MECAVEGDVDPDVCVKLTNTVETWERKDEEEEKNLLHEH